jgi:XRE family transcriptional regulator, regulator of sulfur utilization
MEKEILSKRIGQRLRLYRQTRQLSLEDLALLTGVSKPMLGQIERGTSNPTVATLWKIANGLHVPFTSFISENPSLQLRRAEEQHVFYEDNERFEVYSTFAEQGVPLEMFRVRLHPGCCRISDPHGPGVIETITVYEGSLYITVGDESFSMNRGDALSFQADVPHVYENRSESPTEIAMSIFYQT